MVSDNTPVVLVIRQANNYVKPKVHYMIFVNRLIKSTVAVEQKELVLNRTRYMILPRFQMFLFSFSYSTTKSV